jgi:hypothetical protein
MSRLQWFLLGAGSVLVGLNGLFPPRVHQDHPAWYAGRAFLFSDDLHRFEVEKGKAEPDPLEPKITRYGLGEVTNYREAVISERLLLAQTVLVAGVTGALVALAGILRRVPSTKDGGRANGQASP